MAPELTVRRALPGEASALAAFATRTFLEAFAHAVPADAMTRYLRESFAEARVAAELADPGTLFLVATDSSGDYHGYCKLLFGASPETVLDTPIAGVSRPAEAGPPAKLWRLYTARERQGGGVGGLLMRQAVRSVRERGGGSLWLTVNTGNDGAVRFYERNGFVRIGFTSFNLGGEIHRDFVMERAL